MKKILLTFGRLLSYIYLLSLAIKHSFVRSYNIVIGNGVQTGRRVLISDNSHRDSHNINECKIAVVTKDVPAYSTVVGVPAKMLKQL